MNSEGKQKSNQSFNPTRASVILGLPVPSSQSSYEYIHMYIHTYIYISICKPPTQLRLRNAFNHFICFHPPSSSSDAAPSLGLLGGTFAAAVKCFIYPALMTPLRIGLSESDTHIPIYIYICTYTHRRLLHLHLMRRLSVFLGATRSWGWRCHCNQTQTNAVAATPARHVLCPMMNCVPDSVNNHDRRMIMCYVPPKINSIQV